nr:hypothetical protein OH820_19570 [Streptomyces sp. NBC_00857]
MILVTLVGALLYCLLTWTFSVTVWAAYLLALPFALARIARVALKTRRLIR